MRIAVLTSSRADYGIYLPLLKKIKADSYFELKIIAFGTHLSRFHGYTVEQIEQDGFEVAEKLETLILGDSETAISNAMGNTISRFSSLWERLKQQVDLVFALGDRYEMFAAVAASVPFNIKIAHFYGGDITLGAIDNKFRNAITMMASIHFASTEQYCNRLINLTGQQEHIYKIGVMSFDSLANFALLSKVAFKKKYEIDLTIPTVLCTFHPETVSLDKNLNYSVILVDTFDKLSKDYQIVITMPNADSMGNVIRSHFLALAQRNEKVICVENFGALGYFSCMKHCSLLIGNTSSGIVEAATFNKYVINIGDRQKGRIRNPNVMDLPVEMNAILAAVEDIDGQEFKGDNIFHIKNSTSKVINILKRSRE